MPTRGRSVPTLRRTRARSRRGRSLSVPRTAQATSMSPVVAVPILTEDNAYNAAGLQRVNPRSPRGTRYANSRLIRIFPRAGRGGGLTKRMKK
jgi:hypothetical protein